MSATRSGFCSSAANDKPAFAAVRAAVAAALVFKNLRLFIVQFFGWYFCDVRARTLARQCQMRAEQA
jgi:hypothetical protein